MGGGIIRIVGGGADYYSVEIGGSDASTTDAVIALVIAAGSEP